MTAASFQPLRIAPGETFESETELTKWYGFPSEVLYRFIGAYEFMFFSAFAEDDIALPPRQTAIWMEKIGGEFSVTVHE